MEINSEASLGIFGNGEYMLVFRLSGTSIRYFDCQGWKEVGHPWRFSAPALSPDGKWIAFVEEICPKGPYGGGSYHRVAKCRLDGSEYAVLTKFEGYRNNIQPAWSPDGNSIAYICPNNDELRVMDVDGNIKWTFHSFQPRNPRWSPDGKFLLLNGKIVVDVASGKMIRKLNPPLSEWARWGRGGYLVPQKDGVDFVELDGKTTHRLLQNVSRLAKRSDINKEEFRW